MASAVQLSEVSICVLASMYLPRHCSYPYGWCEQKGQAQMETKLSLIPGSDHLILGLKYTSGTRRGSSALQKCFVSRDVKAVLLTRINIQPTFRRICWPVSGRGLSGASRKQPATTCPCKRHMLSRPFKSYLVDLSGSSFTSFFFLSLKGVMV